MKTIGLILWLIIAIAWVYLWVAGPETDRGLSGGIPGQDIDHLAKPTTSNNFVGEALGWILFIALLLLLPVIAWWSITHFT